MDTKSEPFFHEDQEFNLVRVKGRRLSWFIEGPRAAWAAVTTMPDPCPEENHGPTVKGRLVEDGMRRLEFSSLWEMRWRIEEELERLRMRLTRPKGSVIEGALGDEITRRIRKAR